MQRIPILFFCLACFLGACADIPELEGKISEDAQKLGYPDLIQLDGIDASANEGLETTEEASKALEQRAKDLGERAGDLRDPVIDPEALRRLNEAAQPDSP